MAVLKEVLVIDENGANLGKMQYAAAVNLARGRGLNLVEINNNGDADVYKIIDEGKWKYLSKKSHKKQHAKPLKEFKIHVNTGQHDIDTKVRHMKELLEKQHDIRLSVELRGREKSHFDIAYQVLEKAVSAIGNNMTTDDIKKTDNSVSITIHHIKKQD